MQMNSHGRTSNSAAAAVVYCLVTDRQIILELMAVLNCRLAMSFLFSGVNM